jgi:teichoic acid transport system ATP-binding protein
MYEKVNVDRAKQGEVYVASFTQRMSLQGGEYLLSVSCTGFENGGFTAHHRLYDAVNVTVVSDKNTVGFYDMDSKVKVEKI